jgi:uncharacterized protein (TIGR02266 family)
MFVKRRKLAPNPAHQRDHQRVALEAEVTIDSDHNFYYGLSENISEGGLFVSTFQPAPLGAELELTFTLPGRDDSLKVRGRVQWVREFSALNSDVPPGVGLQFVDPNDELMSAVRSFIRQREPAFYE